MLIVDDIEVASFADDKRPYVSGKDIEELIQSLEETSKILFNRFLDKLMESNVNKCHFLVSTSNKVNIRINNHDISNSKHRKNVRG